MVYVYYQSVKLHYAVTFQMLNHFLIFENVTSCCNIVLLQHVTLLTMLLGEMTHKC